MEHPLERCFHRIFWCSADFDFSCKCCCFPCCCHCSASQHTTTTIGGPWEPSDPWFATSDLGRPPLAILGTQPSKSEPMYAPQADVMPRAHTSPHDLASSSPEHLRMSADVLLRQISPTFAGPQSSPAPGGVDRVSEKPS
ncbi:hypothetical protein PENSPDRAFT_652110 [Peniophora sp. CONT]|nr:hypothetical protein PENSPDRAFT_652110 [Peniophora sp. CONT]